MGMNQNTSLLGLYYYTDALRGGKGIQLTSGGLLPSPFLSLSLSLSLSLFLSPSLPLSLSFSLPPSPSLSPSPCWRSYCTMVVYYRCLSQAVWSWMPMGHLQLARGCKLY